MRFEYLTLGWNVVGVVILLLEALRARSVALAAFGFDSLVEIGASTVVVWELKGDDGERSQQALRLIGYAFVTLVPYVVAVGAVTLLAGHPHQSDLGLAWTATTCAVMTALAVGKRRTGTALGNEVLVTEGKVTLIDAYLAGAVTLGLGLNVLFGWWWADPLASLVVVFYAVREARAIFGHPNGDPRASELPEA